MTTIIALLLALGIISSPDQATDQLIDQYQCEIIITDTETM